MSELRIGQSEPYLQNEGDRFKRLQICDGDCVVGEVIFRKWDGAYDEAYEEGMRYARLFKASPELLAVLKSISLNNFIPQQIDALISEADPSWDRKKALKEAAQ